MEKVIRNGKVAVLYSPSYGGGWSTWGIPDEFIFHPKLVELVEANQQKLITKELMTSLGLDERTAIYGAEDLTIEWVDEGEKFTIDEYDGSESVTLLSNIKYLTA